MLIRKSRAVAGIIEAGRGRCATEIPAAHAIGAGDTRMRDAYFRTGLNVSLLASALVTVVSLVFLNPLVSFLGSDAAAWE